MKNEKKFICISAMRKKSDRKTIDEYEKYIKKFKVKV